MAVILLLLLQVEQWTEVAVEIFSRHQEMNRFDYAPSDYAHSPEHQAMLSLNSDINVATDYCTTQASGENGEYIHLMRVYLMSAQACQK